jgi:hypothetical protein
MKRLLLLFFVVAGIFPAGFGFAGQDLGHLGKLTLVIPNIPRFEEFSVPVTKDIKIADDIDWDSDESSWNIRTRLRKGLKAGPNFADKYAVVTYGCGTQCQGNTIVNVETGKVLGGFSSTYGVEYKRDSRLIIADNPHYSEGDDPYKYGLLGIIDYYVILDDELVLIKRLDISALYTDVDEINKEKEKKRREREKKEDLRVALLRKEIEACVKKYDFYFEEDLDIAQEKAKKIGRECSFAWSLEGVNPETELKITGTGELQGLYYQAWEKLLVKELNLMQKREPKAFVEKADDFFMQKCLLDRVLFKSCRVYEIADLTLFARFLRCNGGGGWLKPLRFEECLP